MKLTLGAVEIDLPDGFVAIETGIMKYGDLFLFGGRRNAGLLNLEFMPVDIERTGLPISPLALILRPI